jgi:hypothetical protein
VGLGVAVAGTGCGQPAPVAPAPPVSSSTTAIPTTIPASAVGFSDNDNGRSVDVALGQQVTVILHSADFAFAPPSDPSVLRDDGDPTVTPGGPSCTEVAGSGCGTIVASFVGLAPGNAELRADRTGCTEPDCPQSAAHWELLLHVVGADPRASTSIPAPPPERDGEVRGTVRFSPVCPVERAPPDPECAPRPGPAAIDLVGADGIVAASARAGDDGAFVVPVAPGRYALRANVSGSASGEGRQANPATVVVAPGAAATVAVSCDTGIR